MNQFPMGAHVGTPPVLGFAGTGSEARLIRAANQTVWYVDSGTANANDGNEGRDPDYPLATFQELIDRSTGASVNRPAMQSFDVVYISGDVEEDVLTGDYLTMPSYISVIGTGPSRYSPAWVGNDANTISLDLRCVGWMFQNFRFYGKAGAAAAELRHTDTGANDIAIRTQFRDCYFDGLTTGLTGIASHGPYDVWIENCTFSLWHNAGGTAAAMRVGTTPLAIPYRNHIKNCQFYDCDNGAVWPCNGSFWYGNMFQPVGYAYAMTQVLNTSVGGNPGDDNVVWGNTFPGDYSIAGGYNPGAADEWLGNWASDTAEAEVGDNGITIARPT